MTSTIVQDAVIRNIEVIGEASRNIEHHYPEFAKVHPQLPLKLAVDTRNALSHGDFKIDLPIVWMMIKNDLPPFRAAVIALGVDSNSSE